MPLDLGAQLAQDQDRQRRRADAVGVVVPVDADALAGGDRPFDRLYGAGHVSEQEGVVARQLAGEEGLRLLEPGVPASEEDAGGRLADAKGLCQRARLAVRAGSNCPIGLEQSRAKVRRGSDGAGYPWPVTVEANYSSGEDYMVEFLGYRFAFNADDFEQRVTASAVRLGLVPGNDLDEDETADLVELAADGRIDEPRSSLGRYLVRHWELLSLVKGESLVYWLRKLVFRGAWLDHRVKEGLLDVDWDEQNGDFGYRDPRGDRALLELAPVPSWHELQFRR